MTPGLTKEQELLKDVFNDCFMFDTHTEVSITIEVYKKLSAYLVEQKLIPAYHFLPLPVEGNENN